MRLYEESVTSAAYLLIPNLFAVSVCLSVFIYLYLPGKSIAYVSGIIAHRSLY